MAKNKKNAQSTQPVETQAVETTSTTKVSKRAAKKVAEAKADAPVKAKKAVTASKYRGAKTGMRVMEYQDHTLAINDEKGRRLTDEELQADWRAEFPNAVPFTLEHVRGVRSLYNLGRHRKGSIKPETPSFPYVIQDGKRVQQTSVSRAPKAKAVKPEPVVTTPVVKVRSRKADKLAMAS